ncbi:cytosolic Fe-S cluster assembling factor nbp35 [Capsaspora owczarzaki ATCC 30864]|uniref:Cytosolic Fe-S cluster assembling factor nbp35 n=1 Tax=Capsaspora owczarzaki (strain ATCC 30864) TaxID=595528 RepID=A0A0D2WPE1_CAPO3|nr:cytosolic Fe-S cluster assembling factor nbp35 [Capsaspora owczarzaki ATCC 30864]KJE93215.1 cytosolic Fe-S cluster assembling factor nbp35 [Capsaspora owczarzaki ATCC 30864]|eukprot:XP_004347860.1 cytosolic Fe-S cluster assembling factor nbp35 [Capsaspora owczarzaki ATCC 30864]
MQKAGGEDEIATAAGCPSDSGMAGRASACEGCPGRELCSQQGGVDPDQAGINVRMNAIRHKVIVLSGKGGVGKSSVAATLAMALAAAGHKVGIVDLDICGPSVPKLLGVEGMPVVNSEYGWLPLKSPHYDIKVMSVGSLLTDADSAIVWRGPRKTGIIKRFLKDTLWGRLDFLIFDTPPGTSDEHLTVLSALKQAKPDGAVLVSTPQDSALVTVRKEITFCNKMGLRILGVVENMAGYVCPCCGEHTDIFSSKGAQKLATEFNLPYLGQVPLDPTLTQQCETGSDIFKAAPNSVSAKAMSTIANTVLEMVKQSR